MAELKKKELRRESAESKKLLRETGSATGQRKRAGTGKDDEGKSVNPEVPDNLKENASAEENAESGKKRSRTRKALLFGIPFISILVIASGLFIFKPDAVKTLMGSSSPRLNPVISITRPIPVPDYHEMLDFIVLKEVEGQKTITSFRIELTFNSPSRYQNFKDQNVVFRDTIYAFLQQQNTSRNSSRSWQSVVEKNLLDFIRIKLPLGWADTIRLTQVENL